MTNFALFHMNRTLKYVPGWPLQIRPFESLPSLTQSRNDILLIPIQLDTKESILSCIQNSVYPHLGKLQHVVFHIDEENLLLIDLWSFVFENILIKFRGLSWHLLLPVESLPFWQNLSIALNYHENVAVFLFVSDIPTENEHCQTLSSTKFHSLRLYDWTLELVSSVVLPEYLLKNQFSLVKSILYRSFFAPDHLNVNSPIISLIPNGLDDENFLQLLHYKKELANFISSTSSSTNFDLNIQNQCVIRDPLQPLRDNLELDIYDVFEKDLNKYNKYETAIRQSIAKFQRDNLKILIIGPGKGPLVDITTIILIMANKFVKSIVTIVEKNTKCIDVLNTKNRKHWENRVNIINIDIRDLQDESLDAFDIIVSELLGSFACNELSPDILSDVPQHLYHLNTIWIPQAYTNYIQPIYSPILTQMMNRAGSRRPFIAELTKHSFKELSQFQALWTFDHEERLLDLSQSKTLTFEKLSGPIHGFLGVFTSILAKDCKIGIHPSQRDTKLFCPSWSPIFFPLESPINAENLTVTFERCFDETRVWYSYTVQGIIHNEHGLRYHISKKTPRTLEL